MIATLSLFVALSDGPLFVTPRVVAATAFRNGFGFVLKAIDIPESGEVYVKDLDFPVNGTFWFAPGEDTSVSFVRLTYVEEDAIQDEAGTINDLLLLNVGKPVELEVMDYGKGRTRTLRGTLRGMSERTVSIESGGKVQMLPREWVMSVIVDAKTGSTKMTTKVKTPALHIRGRGGKKGVVYTVGLLRGLSWSPAYYLDISDPKTMRLTMKANVINMVADLDDVDLGMVSGFPEISHPNQQDPLTSGVARVFELAQKYSAPPSAFPEGGRTTGGTGGFGGGGMGGSVLSGTRPGTFVPTGITRVAYDPTDNSLIVQGTDKAIQDLEQQISTSQVNDLFVYTALGITLRQSDRCYFVIQESEAQYDYRFVAETSKEIGPSTVVKSLVFKNETSLPWTDAPAMMVNKGQLVGQAPMPYTVTGDEAEVRVGKATTVLATSTREQVSREANFRTIGTGVWDLIHMRDTVLVTNLDKVPVVIRVRRTVDGKVTRSTDSGRWTHTTANDTMNSIGAGQWEVTLFPGERKELTVDYDSYVRVR